ncbi:hypothetical protein C8Q78DRAFT_995466 [Trametes maxima]|nr:hypothetical protein C8Q78DRAFT_995466 [Trametes maxima]
MVEYCTGKTDGVPLNKRILERWDLRCGAWQGLSIGESFPLEGNVSTILVRHNENRQPLGFGYQLAQAERACIAMMLKTNDATGLGDGEGKLDSATEVARRKKRRLNGAPKADIPNMSKEEIRNRTRVEDGHEYLCLKCGAVIVNLGVQHKEDCRFGQQVRYAVKPSRFCATRVASCGFQTCRKSALDALNRQTFSCNYHSREDMPGLTHWCGGGQCLHKECKLAHYPTQDGPSEDLLERIEAQRDIDDAGALRSRVVARREQVARTRAAQQVRDQQGSDSHRQRRMLMGLHRLAGGSNETRSTSDVHRVIPLVLWFSACKPTNILVFENWLFDMGQWQAIPWVTSKVDVPAGIDRIFLRVMGICTVGFGEELCRFEGRSFMFSQPALRPSMELPIAGTAPADTVWKSSVALVRFGALGHLLSLNFNGAS